MAKKNKKGIVLPKIPTILMCFFLFAGDIASGILLLIVGDINLLKLVGM